MIPFSCPTCHGHGTVQKPPWVAGDQTTWVSTTTGSYPCRCCNGTGIVWTKAEHSETCEQ